MLRKHLQSYGFDSNAVAKCFVKYVSVTLWLSLEYRCKRSVLYVLSTCFVRKVCLYYGLRVRGQKYIHGPSRRFRGDQNDEDTRTFCGKFLYNAIASTDNAQHKNCPSTGFDDRSGRDLFRVLKSLPIYQQHTLRLRRGYSDGKAVGNTTGLRRRLHQHWRISN